VHVFLCGRAQTDRSMAETGESAQKIICSTRSSRREHCEQGPWANRTPTRAVFEYFSLIFNIR